MSDINYDGMQICGVSNLLGAGENCKWREKTVTWTVVGQLPNVSASDLVEAYKLAWSYWENVCDIKAQYVQSASQAMVVMGSGRIDGSGKVLAWSEMPCGNHPNQLKQKYDTTENWVIRDRPPRNRIDIVRVACHEIGHVIGIPHIGVGNLMAPTYSQRIRDPQAGDISEAVGRYGRPLPTPEPEPTPDPTPEPDGGFSWWGLLFKILVAIFTSLVSAKDKMIKMFKK